MTLQNLLGIGRLKEHEATAAEIQRLLAGAERNLRDARIQGVSEETRFDAAYKAVMQCALAAMMAAGYRPSTHEPGHHQTMIQSLPLTLGVANETWVVLDAFRRKRNAIDYSGDIVDAQMVAVTVKHAGVLLQTLRSWLTSKRPELLKKA